MQLHVQECQRNYPFERINQLVSSEIYYVQNKIYYVAIDEQQNKRHPHEDPCFKYLT